MKILKDFSIQITMKHRRESLNKEIYLNKNVADTFSTCPFLRIVEQYLFSGFKEGHGVLHRYVCQLVPYVDPSFNHSIAIKVIPLLNR